MTLEEIRIRVLVADITGEQDLLLKVPRDQWTAGLEQKRLSPDTIVSEFHTQAFRDQIRAWPDVFDVVVKHGLMMKPDYILCPYGKLMYNNVRYVAEMMLSKDGDQVLGVPSSPENGILNLTQVVASGKLSFRSNGVYLVNLKFVLSPTAYDAKNNTTAKTIEHCMWRDITVPKPIAVGVTNKKLRIIQDCKIQGFYFQPIKAFPAR